ncbi:MAG: zinc dependent phospholipase C family protein [Terracidiphilus sp.]
MRIRRVRSRTILLLVLLFAPSWLRRADAYSLLTHEKLIDLTWQSAIVPLLLSRYPSLTPAELDQARAYAYGGCVIQDIGYYPFGDRSFSNLTHYVRSGDFVVNLFRNATNANELAFAVGALSHYIGDSNGHPLATNIAVPVEFPSLAHKYGPVVSYAEGKRQHVQTEFAFDINEIAHHRMAPIHYLRHIGLGVSVRQLALAYYRTYGLTEDFSQHRRRRFNVGGYRFAVRGFIPRIAYAITLLHRKVEPADPNTPEVVELRKEVAAVAAQNNWDFYRRKAGIGTYMLAGFLFILPKIGPLSLVAVKGPNAKTEAEYVHSVTVSDAALRHMLARFTPPSTKPATGADPPPLHALPVDRLAGPSERVRASDPCHPLPNRDLDTGQVVKPGGYLLTDSTYADLLHRLTRQPDRPIPPGIKEDILAFYSNPNLPITTKKDAKKWAQVQADLKTLKNMPTSPEPKPYPTYGDEADDAQ